MPETAQITVDTRTARDTLARLRLELMEQEANLTASAARLDAEGHLRYAELVRTRLGVVRQVFDIIGH